MFSDGIFHLDMSNFDEFSETLEDLSSLDKSSVDALVILDNCEAYNASSSQSRNIKYLKKNLGVKIITILDQ